MKSITMVGTVFERLASTVICLEIQRSVDILYTWTAWLDIGPRRIAKVARAKSKARALDRGSDQSRLTAQSRVTTIRLPSYLEAALKVEAEAQGKPWQTLLKDLLKEALGLSDTDASETETRSATDLHHAMRKLKSR